MQSCYRSRHDADADTRPRGTQAYSWLAPGFPASNRDGLKDIQAFDPEAGKRASS